MVWIALNASLERFKSEWFLEVAKKLSGDNYFFPWFENVNGIQYIVEGTFFIRKEVFDFEIEDFFDSYKVNKMYEISSDDIRKLQEIKEKLMYINVVKEVDFDKMYFVKKIDHLFNNCLGRPVYVEGDKVLMKFELRSSHSYDVCQKRYLEEYDG